MDVNFSGKATEDFLPGDSRLFLLQSGPQVPLAVRGLAVRERREDPSPCGRRFRVSLDNSVDDKRPVRLDGTMENFLEVTGLGHLGPIGSTGFCQSGKIGIIELSRLLSLEARHDFPTWP